MNLIIIIVTLIAISIGVILLYRKIYDHFEDDKPEVKDPKDFKVDLIDFSQKNLWMGTAMEKVSGGDSWTLKEVLIAIAYILFFTLVIYLGVTKG